MILGLGLGFNYLRQRTRSQSSPPRCWSCGYPELATYEKCPECGRSKFARPKYAHWLSLFLVAVGGFVVFVAIWNGSDIKHKLFAVLPNSAMKAILHSSQADYQFVHACAMKKYLNTEQESIILQLCLDALSGTNSMSATTAIDIVKELKIRNSARDLFIIEAIDKTYWPDYIHAIKALTLSCSNCLQIFEHILNMAINNDDDDIRVAIYDQLCLMPSVLNNYTKTIVELIPPKPHADIRVRRALVKLVLATNADENWIINCIDNIIKMPESKEVLDEIPSQLQAKLDKADVR